MKTQETLLEAILILAASVLKSILIIRSKLLRNTVIAVKLVIGYLRVRRAARAPKKNV